MKNIVFLRVIVEVMIYLVGDNDFDDTSWFYICGVIYEIESVSLD